jgi:hypothetical protein
VPYAISITEDLKIIDKPTAVKKAPKPAAVCTRPPSGRTTKPPEFYADSHPAPLLAIEKRAIQRRAQKEPAPANVRPVIKDGSSNISADKGEEEGSTGVLVILGAVYSAYAVVI